MYLLRNSLPRSIIPTEYDAREIFKLSLLIRNPIRCVNNTNDPKTARFINNDTAYVILVRN